MRLSSRRGHELPPSGVGQGADALLPQHELQHLARQGLALSLAAPVALAALVWAVMAVIDGAPHLHDLLTACAWISTLVIVPVKPSPNDLWKLGPMIERLESVREMRAQGGLEGPAIRFLVNENMERTRLSREVVEALEAYDFPVFDSKIGSRMDYRDSFTQGLAALEYANPKAKAEIVGLFGEVKTQLGINKVG